MPPFAAKGHYPPFVVLFPPFPPASTQTGSANTFTLISCSLVSSDIALRLLNLKNYLLVGRRLHRGSDVCISSGRTTFDGARQSGHVTDTPLRRLIDRSTSDLAYESEHDAHIAWEHSKTVASAVSLS